MSGVTRTIKPRKVKGPPRSEHVRVTKRRIEKAERDERVDIGMMLTQPKTYMGGFTRPRDLRVLAWSKGGAIEKRKVYEPPNPEAYTPHTVYLLEARYPSKRMNGRAPAIEHVVGFCRESELTKRIAAYNSGGTSKDLLEAMDTAQWPWLPEKRGRRIKWWVDLEDRKATLREVYGDDADAASLDDAEVDIVEDDETAGVNPASKIDPSHIPNAPSQLSLGSQQTRSFHTSSRVLYPTSYNEDDVVPDFYIRHKEDRAPQSLAKPRTDIEAVEREAHDPARKKTSVKRRKHEESGLMTHLSDSILSDEIAASTRRLKAKIPVEHYDADGILIRHPSGFVVPGPGHSSTSDFARAKERDRDEDEDRAAQTAAVAERVLESDLDLVHAAMASTRPRSHKVPFEVREPDGTVKHPSGFVPPTPANEFRYSDSASLDRDLSGAIGRQRAREASASDATRKLGRSLHTTSVVKASETYPPFPSLSTPPPLHVESPPTATPSTDTSPTSSASSDSKHAYAIVEKLERSRPVLTAPTRAEARAKGIQLTRAQMRAMDPLPDPTTIRAQYMPLLASQPFFRPLVTLTFSTRPLAETVARLSKALPTGLSYVAAVDPEERKYGPSFATRIRNMRLRRLQWLGLEVARLLAGTRGGMLGVRFSPEERGRGVDGEGFGELLEHDKRVIGVGVGNWFARAAEVKEAYKEDGVEMVRKMYGVGKGEGEPFKVYGLDDWGKRIDDETGEEIPYEQPKLPRITSLQLAEERMTGLEVARSKKPERILEALGPEERMQRKSSVGV
ncbi:hypothetical protein BU15DRAFT_60129 [Melanogaster broomeanus]|nr:hypothetical protein BU15DRAFT_60129 [Melanogaster broomeanus]